MNLSQLEDELSLIVLDKSLKNNFARWLNEGLEDLALEFSLPYLKRLEPFPFSVNTGSWLYDLPDVYQKIVFKVLNGDRSLVTIQRFMTDLDALDEAHTETGERVRAVAVEAGKIGTYPKADDTLYLWFYEKPTPLEKPGDVPRCLPAPYHQKVLIPKVVIKNFQLLQDMMLEPPHQSLTWWTAELRNGLYGSPGGDIGLLNVLARDRKPRRHGGRNPIP